MRIKKFVSGLFACIVFAGILLISCANHSKAKGENVGTEIEDFESFLEKFTSSAAFQYTRIKFPMKTPITLMTDDGNSEKTFPFTKDKWPLLDSETLKEERITQEEGGIYVSKFTLNESGHKVFEAGYEEGLPAFYQVEFNVDEPADTFLDMTGWGKGFVVVNAFNLGRFWEEGPQRRLYLPGALLKPGKNELLIFETEGKHKATVILCDTPDLGDE